MMEELLLNYLKVACRGRDFCASSTELGRAIGVGRKTIQKLVSRLRRKKKPICSANSGYFYARTAQDIIRTIEMLQRMIDGLQADIQGLKSVLSKEEYYLMRRIVLDNATYKEMSEELGIKLWACQKRMQRILKKLREYFDKSK